MARGGAREGAGRKTKAEEFKLIETMDKALGEKWVDDILKIFHKKAKAGSFLHGQILLQYKFGKPQDHLDVTSKGEKLETGKQIVFQDYAKNKP